MNRGKKSFSKVAEGKPSSAMTIKSENIKIKMIRSSGSNLIIFLDQLSLNKSWRVNITNKSAINTIGHLIGWNLHSSLVELEPSIIKALLLEMDDISEKRPEKEVFQVLYWILQGCNKALLEDVFLLDFQKKEIDLLVDAINELLEI